MKENEKIRFKTVDDYVNSYPPEIAKKMQLIRDITKKEVPEAKEVISYNMPAYKYKGMLLYFAAHTSHIGFYAMKSANVVFKKELKEFKTSVGGIQFPFDKDIPVELVSKIVKYRKAENEEKENLKKMVKKKKV